MIDRVSQPRTSVAAKVPNIPAPPAKIDPPLRKYLETLAEAIDIRLGRRGDVRDRAVTLRELIDSGMAEDLVLKPFVAGATQDFAPVSPWTGNEIPYYDTPPAPTSFSVSGGYEIIVLSWDFPYYRNHAHTEIWRHDSNVIGNATLLGIHSGRVYIDRIGGDVTLYYWIRHINTAGVAGPFHSATGLTGTTSANVTKLLTDLSGEIQQTHLHSTLSSEIDQITTNENAITDINNVSAGSSSASATAVRALNSVIYDNAAGTGSPVVTATNLTTMKTQVLNANGTATATAVQMNYLNSTYTNPTTGTANDVTLEQALETSASNVNGLRGQYSVKIDTNGHVAGFGLSSTTTGATPTSAFIVNADKFAIIGSGDSSNGLGTTTPSSGIIPFFVDSGTTYIKAAMIKDASIESAKIDELNGNKITAGTITSDRISTNKIEASKIKLDNGTIEGNASGEIRIKDLGVTNAKIANSTITTAKINSLIVYDVANSNTMGKLFTVTSGYTATTAYNTNSTTNMSYASVTSDWTDDTYNNPWHYNNTAGTTMPGLLIDGSASGNNFTIPDVEGDNTHVEVSIHFGTNPVGAFNGDESSFCVCHLQRADSSINNTGAYSEDTQVWGGSVATSGSNLASVPRYGVFTASLNPGTWYVWLYAWSRKADTNSASQHGFSDSFVHVNSFYR